MLETLTANSLQTCPLSKGDFHFIESSTVDNRSFWGEAKELDKLTYRRLFPVCEDKCVKDHHDVHQAQRKHKVLMHKYPLRVSYSVRSTHKLSISFSTSIHPASQPVSLPAIHPSIYQSTNSSTYPALSIYTQAYQTVFL